MSYVAEPYGQFVDDLLAALTGGASRQRFVFLPAEQPFRLTAGTALPGTVRVYGQAGGEHRRFRPQLDFELGPDQTLLWRVAADGGPAADAVWPDEGTVFFANYEVADPGGALPLLTDRNPGSVTRLLAESFAREYTVLSRQLEGVYRAGFVDTAGGRDLDQLVALVGLRRRAGDVATGSVVFARGTPAPADVYIPAGTRLSAAEPPGAAFETTEDRTLHRGELSVEAPIAALEPGPDGVAAAGDVRVIHRPILGIESAANPQPTRFAASAESDEALRARARRAHPAAGKATTGALLAALTSLPGLAEKDVRIDQDQLAHPGVIRVQVVLPPEADEELRRRAVERIEETRPAGVRVLHDLQVALPFGEALPEAGDEREGTVEAPVALGTTGDGAGLLPVAVQVRLTPLTLSLTGEQRRQLERRGEQVVQAFFERAGIGDVLVYNRLLADLMAIDGVLDADLRLYPRGDAGQPQRKNLFPAANLKPVAAQVAVQIGGRLVVVDASFQVTLKGAGLNGDPGDNLELVRVEVENHLRDRIASLAQDLTPSSLLGLLEGAANYGEFYDLSAPHYEVSFLEAGVRVRKRDVTVPPSGLEQLWIGRVTVSRAGGGS